MQRLCLWIVFVAASITVVSAHAAVVDPDSFSSGTDISNAFAGVTLSALTTTGTLNPVYSVTDSYASTGDRVFSASSTANVSWFQGIDFSSALRIDFATVVNTVSIDVISDNHSDYGTLEIFDASNNSLGYVASSVMTSPGQYTTLTLGSATAIAYAIAGGQDSTVDNVLLDNLQYAATDVPEPATLAIWGLFGVWGAGVAVRRRRKAA